MNDNFAPLTHVFYSLYFYHWTTMNWVTLARDFGTILDSFWILIPHILPVISMWILHVNYPSDLASIAALAFVDYVDLSTPSLSTRSGNKAGKSEGSTMPLMSESSVITGISLGLHHGEHPVLPNLLYKMTWAFPWALQLLKTIVGFSPEKMSSCP